MKRSKNPIRLAREKEKALPGRNWWLEHTNEYYDALWEAFIDMYRDQDLPNYDYRIITLAENEEKGSLKLDIGCGHGLMSHKLENTVFCDFSNKILTKFWLGRKDAIKVQGEIFNLPFRESAFNLVIASEILEHLDVPWRALEEIRRVLAPGGLVLASVPQNNTRGEPGHFFHVITEEMLKDWFHSFEDLKIETILPDPWRSWTHYVISARKGKI